MRKTHAFQIFCWIAGILFFICGFFDSSLFAPGVGFYIVAMLEQISKQLDKQRIYR